MRQSEDYPLDPELLAELEVIEATLAGEIVDPLHAELAELTLLLAAERPRLPDDAARRLDARVAQRFAFRQPAARAHDARRLSLGGRVLPGFGLLATAVAALALIAVVAIPGLGGGSSSPASHGAAGLDVRKAANGTMSAKSTAASSVQDAPSPAPVTNGRRIVQSAQLQLLTPAARIDTVAQELFNVVGQLQGIVKSSTVTAAAGNGGFASFSLSIPSGSLAQAMTRLSALPYAHVASRTDATQDVNNQYLSDVRQLADARALRTSLLKQLAAATTTEEVTSLTAQIHDAEASISSDESTLSGLSHQIAYSGLSVQINAGSVPVPLAAGGGRSASGFTLGKAAHDAGRVLTVAAGVVLIGLAGLLPVALIGALAMWIAHLIRARRREQALDAA
jgi:hypothetical protein